MLPHVVGYHEVNCTGRGQGTGPLRDSVTQLASKLIAANADIPRRWLNVDRSLVARTERSGSVCTLDELRDIAAVQGVTDSQDVLNMIHFFRAQGRILYFPQVGALSLPSVVLQSYGIYALCVHYEIRKATSRTVFHTNSKLTLRINILTVQY